MSALLNLVEEHLIDTQAKLRFTAHSEEGCSPVISAYWAGLKDERLFANELADLLRAPRVEVFQPMALESFDQSIPAISFSVPIGMESEKVLILGMVDPADFNTIDQVQSLTRFRVKPRTISMQQFVKTGRLKPDLEYVERLVNVILVEHLREGREGVIRRFGSACCIEESFFPMAPGFLGEHITNRLRHMANMERLEEGGAGIVLQMDNSRAYILIQFSHDDSETRFGFTDRATFEDLFHQ